MATVLKYLWCPLVVTGFDCALGYAYENFDFQHYGFCQFGDSYNLSNHTGYAQISQIPGNLVGQGFYKNYSGLNLMSQVGDTFRFNGTHSLTVPGFCPFAVNQFYNVVLQFTNLTNGQTYFSTGILDQNINYRQNYSNQRLEASYVQYCGGPGSSITANEIFIGTNSIPSLNITLTDELSPNYCTFIAPGTQGNININFTENAVDSEGDTIYYAMDTTTTNFVDINTFTLPTSVHTQKCFYVPSIVAAPMIFFGFAHAGSGRDGALFELCQDVIVPSTPYYPQYYTPNGYCPISYLQPNDPLYNTSINFIQQKQVIDRNDPESVLVINPICRLNYPTSEVVISLGNAYDDFTISSQQYQLKENGHRMNITLYDDPSPVFGLKIFQIFLRQNATGVSVFDAAHNGTIWIGEFPYSTKVGIFNYYGVDIQYNSTTELFTVDITNGDTNFTVGNLPGARNNLSGLSLKYYGVSSTETQDNSLNDISYLETIETFGERVTPSFGTIPNRIPFHNVSIHGGDNLLSFYVTDSAHLPLNQFGVQYIPVSLVDNSECSVQPGDIKNSDVPSASQLPNHYITQRLFNSVCRLSRTAMNIPLNLINRRLASRNLHFTLDGCLILRFLIYIVIVWISLSSWDVLEPAFKGLPEFELKILIGSTIMIVLGMFVMPMSVNEKVLASLFFSFSLTMTMVKALDENKSTEINNTVLVTEKHG